MQTKNTQDLEILDKRKTLKELKEEFNQSVVLQFDLLEQIDVLKKQEEILRKRIKEIDREINVKSGIYSRSDSDAYSIEKTGEAN